MLKITTESANSIPIDIDGKKYELLPYDGLKFQDFFELQKFAMQFEKFKDIETANLNAEQIKKMEDSLDMFCAKILPGVPKNILDKVNYMSKIQIMEVFMETVPQEVEVNTVNSSKSSQGSFGSMGSVSKSS